MEYKSGNESKALCNKLYKPTSCFVKSPTYPDKYKEMIVCGYTIKSYQRNFSVMFFERPNIYFRFMYDPLIVAFSSRSLTVTGKCHKAVTLCSNYVSRYMCVAVTPYFTSKTR